MELHDPEGIRACFQQGLDPQRTVHGRNWLEELVGEYTRSPRFSECVKVLLACGVTHPDGVLTTVLQNDAARLDTWLQQHPQAVHRRYTLPCAYTPLHEVTLLHVCAEFNLTACAEVLYRHGADVDAAAGTDALGLGAQTPVFHTVNQNGNQSHDMLQWLLQHDALLTHTVRGLVWGKGYPWETFIPAVNPISYALMGLLPQMHRHEKTTHETVRLLMAKAYGLDYPLMNVPNRYLNG